MTRPPMVSIVVPTRNAGRTLGACLDSLARQPGAPYEVLVVDNFSTDDTETIARRSVARVLRAGGERSRQRNVGLHAARGSIVVFLDADMVAPEDLVRTCATLTERGLDAAVLPLESFGTGFWSECKVLERRCYEKEPSVEAARVFDREQLIRLGGFNESLHAFEDWELHDRVLDAGGRIGRLPFSATPLLHDEGHLTLSDRLRKARYYGLALRQYRTTPSSRYRLSAPRRAALFVRHAPVLARRPVLAAGLVILKVAEAAGGWTSGVLGRASPVPAVWDGKVGEG